MYYSAGFENSFTGKDHVHYLISQVYFVPTDTLKLLVTLTLLCILLACLVGLPVHGPSRRDVCKSQNVRKECKKLIRI